jgi:outer membrane protein assembly factor BamB
VSALRRSDGKVLWQIRTGAIVESSPAVVDDTAYFGTTDGRLYAVATSNGRVRWAYDTGGRINSSPSIAEGRICITTYAGSVFCLRRATGEKLWSTYVKRDSFRYESFYASASTDGRRLYTIARSGRVVTLDARTGDVLWTRQQGGYGYSTPAVGADRIFVGGFDGALRAYRKTDGEELWRAAVGGRVLGAPVLVGDLVFFSTLETETYAARASDGKVVWHLGMGKYSPGIATERAYYFTLNGILVAFRGRDAPD